jgi:protoheme IX farnesyltransferase
MDFRKAMKTNSILKKISDYVMLTKPSIMLLVVITGGTALIMQGDLVGDPFRFFLVIFSLYLTGGSANALNQYFERDIDKLMTRTAKRRPLPQGKIPSTHALIFAISIGLTGVLIFGFVFNWLTALLSLSTILFYSLIYTLLLKPNTDQNIVIGGIAGAMAPVGAWTAATGEMALAPWILFLIVFFWTPPHFWALALFYQDDYRASKLPMMPVIRGEDVTLKQIMVYSVILILVSLTLFFVESGVFYLAVAVVSGAVFLHKAWRLQQNRSRQLMRGLFGYSIVYLFVLFAAIVADVYIQRFFA